MSKVGFCRQKSKLVLFSHEILCCKTFQMTYYLFIYDVPNRSCVTLKYSRVGNYFWRKTQSKFGKCASLETHTYSKTTRTAVLTLWAAAHWWAADLCLVARNQGWELRNLSRVTIHKKVLSLSSGVRASATYLNDL